jgi:uncharacterized protein YggU (UPF0235/DUF167 family)
MDPDLRLHDGKMGSAITVQVITGGRSDEFIDVLGDGTLQVKLACNAEQEVVNARLVRFLSRILGVPRSQIDIVAGLSSRSKIVSILDLSSEETTQRIIKALEKN